LVLKLGSDWEQQLEQKWGFDWRESCEEELVRQLGADWAASPQLAAEKLAESATGASTGETGWEEDQLAHDPDQPLPVDLGEYQWLSTVAEADSLHSWLARVGVPEDLAGALASGDAGRLSGADPDQPLPVDLSEYQWLATVTETDSLRSWLDRVGVPEELASPLAEAAK
jgi:hypothetical protein